MNNFAKHPPLLIKLSLVVISCIVLPVTDAASGWPAYRGNPARSGFSNSTLSMPLQEAWRLSLTPPRPAWTSPARRSYWQQLENIQARVTDDWVNHPVSVGKYIWIGSSTDDSVRCIDSRTGRQLWQFIADAPVRYAPAFYGRSLFFGSDDGNLYCLNAASGALIWKQRLGPQDWRIPGNGRMISPWPLRTGVLVNDGVVYAVAGLYPSQGVYAAAFRAPNGALIWKQKINYSAQGYLLASPENLFIPTGRSNPISLNRATGAFVKEFKGNGGAYAVLIEDALFSGRGNDGILTALPIRPTRHLASFKGSEIAASPRFSYLLDNAGIRAIDRIQYRRQAALVQDAERKIAAIHAELKKGVLNPDQVRRSRGEINRHGILLDTAKKGLLNSEKWRVTMPGNRNLIAVQNCLIVGGDDSVHGLSTADGSLLWSAQVEGAALSLAVASGRLLVNTDKGFLHCFSPTGNEASGDPRGKTSGVESRQQADLHINALESVQRLTETLRAKKGWALVLDAVDGSLAVELAKATQLKIVLLSPNARRVDQIRDMLKRRALYGTRITAHFLDKTRLPFTDYFANFITSEATWLGELTSSEWLMSEIQRVLQPVNGVAWLDPSTAPTVADGLKGAGEWTHQYGNPANTCDSGDQLVTSNLMLQWFGGPGAAPMVDRHLRAPAPLATGGKLIIPGENLVIAVDAFNGTELWQLPLPGSQRYSMPYDAGYMSVDGNRLCVAVQDESWLVNLSNGAVMEKFDLSNFVPGRERHWGYALLADNRLFGSAQETGASRTRPSRGLISRDYNNNQPLVTGTHLFSARLKGNEVGQGKWSYESSAILNPTITLSEGRMFFVEIKQPLTGERGTGRIRLAKLLGQGARIVCLDANTGGKLWECPVDGDLENSRNMIYLAATGKYLVATGSHLSANNDTTYQAQCFSAENGKRIWSASHDKEAPGAFTHGEQVHHPVILGKRLVIEPAIYELATGKRLGPMDKESTWALKRPGHSCGTLSGAGDCLFFRAGNPTVLDLGKQGGNQFQTLAPTRPGCWINILPAQGLVLIPEASSGCVCHFSLQTSMAFRPIQEGD